MMQREGVAGRTLLAIWCYDCHLAERFGRFGEALESVGKNAVVVRKQEVHQRADVKARRNIATTTLDVSRSERKWLRPPSYTVGTGTDAMRNPARAAATSSSVSYS